MGEIRVLQIGNEDWNGIYQIPPEIRVDYTDCYVGASKRPYDIYFLDRLPQDGEIDFIYKEARAYTLFYTEKVRMEDVGTGSRAEWLFCCKKAKEIKTAEIGRFLKEEAFYYFSKPYGENYGIKTIAIAHGFKGSVKWEGNYSVILRGFFGEGFR